MSDYQMGVAESRFADMIWEREPISSTELSKIADDVLNWKKSTTYTVLRRLCEKGIFRNQGGQVTHILTRGEYYALRSESFVKENFEGSLPAFFAAFTSRKKLSREEADELRRMIAEYPEE